MYVTVLSVLSLVVTVTQCTTTTSSTLGTRPPKLTTEKDTTLQQTWTTSTEDGTSSSTTASTTGVPGTTSGPTTSSTTGIPDTPTTVRSSTTTEWTDMDDDESEKLVSFVVSEIQKLKMEHRELDDCQELNLSTVLSGKKLTSGKTKKYSVTLKVQPQIKATELCLKQNATSQANMHPEICEADVTVGDHGDSDGKTLLRSTCLQVEELQE